MSERQCPFSSSLYILIYLLPGPYYKFRTYHDMLSNEASPDIDVTSYMMGRLKWIPIVGIAYLILSHFIYIDVSTKIWCKVEWIYMIRCPQASNHY